ncbi:ribonuclease H-like superfamily protein [Striga asiatica]|uniref:Ribonuclease H-like superfamily protein n=1 Tax=Striga asiatica TaxID=4170 RepID=A0A5A7QE88_STRAF|nr:ribonuclease H-like superfamily protein [Striga asiatica]
MDPHKPDRLRWIWSKNGKFTVASAYAKFLNKKWSLLDRPEGSTNNIELKNARKKLWNLKVKGKLKHIIWTCINNILSIMSNLPNKILKLTRFSLCIEVWILSPLK